MMAPEKPTAAASETIAQKLFEREQLLEQFRRNMLETEIAYEDTLARDGDVQPHLKALANHRVAIAELESTIAGLRRRRVLEKRDELRDTLRAGLDEYDTAMQRYGHLDSEVKAVQKALEALYVDAEAAFRAKDIAWQRCSVRRASLANFEAEYAEALERAVAIATPEENA